MINNMNGTYVPNFQMGMPGYQTMANNRLATAMNNVLTDQQKAELKQDIYSIQLTPQQLLKNICNHKNNGTFSLRKDPTRGDGYMICNICGSSVKIIDDDKNAVMANIEYTKNVIETIQTLGVELGENYLKEIGKMKSLITMLPQMHEAVLKTWYEKYAQSSIGNANAGSNSASIFNYMTSGGQALYNPNLMQQNLMSNGLGFNGQPIGGGYGYPQQQQMQMNGMGMNMNMGYPQQQQMQMNGMGMNMNMGYPQQQMQMGMQTPPTYANNMNMNYPNQQQVTSDNFFANNNVQQPAYATAPMHQQVQAQQTAAQPAGQPQQNYQGPGAVADKIEDKAIASKTVNP